MGVPTDDRHPYPFSFVLKNSGQGPGSLESGCLNEALRPGEGEQVSRGTRCGLSSGLGFALIDESPSIPGPTAAGAPASPGSSQSGLLGAEPNPPGTFTWAEPVQGIRPLQSHWKGQEEVRASRTSCKGAGATTTRGGVGGLGDGRGHPQDIASIPRAAAGPGSQYRLAPAGRCPGPPP